MDCGEKIKAQLKKADAQTFVVVSKKILGSDLPPHHMSQEEARCDNGGERR
jgi:hypothetical protein